jgi:two-component system CheB/CheR fusion protein
MKNLLDSTETATVFLDNELNILRFTPQVKKLFNVIAADIGRSITHVVSNFDYTAIEDDIKDVIDSLKGKELEIKTRKNEWYNLRIMPYRTLDNFINGAVLTFNKITPVKALESKLAMLQHYADLSLDLISEPALLLDKELQIQGVNKSFLDFFRINMQELSGLPLIELLHNRWKINTLDILLNKSQKKELAVSLQTAFPIIGLKALKVNTYPSVNPETNEVFSTVLILKEVNDDEKR